MNNAAEILAVRLSTATQGRHHHPSAAFPARSKPRLSRAGARRTMRPCAA